MMNMCCRGVGRRPNRRQGYITIRHTGATFAAYTEITAGGAVRWEFADGTYSTETAPYKNFGTAATRDTILRFTPGTLRTLSVGHSQSGDRPSGAPAGMGAMPTLASGAEVPNLDAQNVTAITGLQAAASSLVNLTVSNNVGLTTLNLSGLTLLRDVEAFACFGLTTVTLAGCSDLRRICCEGAPIAAWDLSDCLLLEDFRNRTNHNDSGIYSTWTTITWGSNPRAYLWHLCIGSNPNTVSLGATSFPALTQLWIWRSTGLTGTLTVNAPLLQQILAEGCHITDVALNCPVLRSCDLQNCQLTQAGNDNALRALAANGVSNGEVTLTGNPHGPSNTIGAADLALLTGRSWSASTGTTEAINYTPTIRTQFNALSARGAWFAHQSVGQNLVDGLTTLLSPSGSSMSIVDTSTPGSMGATIFAEDENGTNGDPAGKISAFNTAIRTGGIGAALTTAGGIAILKFCWVDFTTGTDVAALSSTLDSVWSALRTDFPAVRFAMCTVPLKTDADADGHAVNVVREQLSAHIRNTAVFNNVVDLALFESTDPAGARVLVSGVPALHTGYTTDAGHLDTTLGSDTVTRAFLTRLAALAA